MYLVKFFISCIYILSIPQCISAEQKQEDFGFRYSKLSINGDKYDYQVHIPEGYKKKREWPVILFLHGAGERGNNTLLPTKVGLGAVIRKQSALYPAITVFPQCPSKKWWSSKLCEQIALASLAKVITQYAINPKRIYLTGISMGGFGVWEFASKYPNKWSALFVIAARVKPGGGHKPSIGSISSKYHGDKLYLMTAKAVSHIPTWIVHGTKDDVVPVTESRKMYQYLKLENAQVVYKEFVESWHNVWDKAYLDSDAIQWLFAQKKERKL